MDDKWAAEVGQRIALARKTKAMTQGELAQAIGRSTSMVSMYEQGRRAPWNEIRQIAEVTNADIRWLLHGESYQDPLDRLTEQLAELRRDLKQFSVQGPPPDGGRP